MMKVSECVWEVSAEKMNSSRLTQKEDHPSDNLKQVAKLLRDKGAFLQAMKTLGSEPHSKASDDQKALWHFIHFQGVKAVLCKKERDELRGKKASEVNVDKLIAKVHVSEEAMVMTTMIAKIRDWVEDTDNGKGQEKKKGGRRKKKPSLFDNDGKEVSDPTEVSDAKCEKRHHVLRHRVHCARQNEVESKEGWTWCEAIVEEAKQRHKKNREAAKEAAEEELDGADLQFFNDMLGEARACNASGVDPLALTTHDQEETDILQIGI